MGVNRRDFLRMAGLAAALGLGGKAAYELMFPGQLEAAEGGIEGWWKSKTPENPLYPGDKAPGNEVPNPNALTARRWGMALDMRKLDAATRKAAVDACHTVHNVPTIPGKQDIKWIWETKFVNAFPDLEQEYMDHEVHETPFLVLCNHCDNPPCVRVCPTKATFRRADGIVMMDMHRCIGCRFCMAACPFGSRSFNFSDPRRFFPKGEAPTPDYPTRTKGVVEKCTFCTERLVKGQLPACVEATKGAILFGDMADAGAPVRQALRNRYAIRRKNELGTHPQVYYLI
ncbi:MAG: sulfate reduction electron transfer complex DsrMKJOP subunit DsrO [Thermodesulfobacteriota bacterium]